MFLFYTWIVMLALGNFGFSHFGYVDALPLGFIVSVLAPPSVGTLQYNGVKVL